MDQETIMRFHFSLKSAEEAIKRCLGARIFSGIQFKHQLAPQSDAIRQAFDDLAQARTTLEELADDLPEQDQPKPLYEKVTKVKAHKRKLHKPRTLEEAGGDPSKLESLEDAVENGVDLGEFVQTERKHKGLPAGVEVNPPKEAT